MMILLGHNYNTLKKLKIASMYKPIHIDIEITWSMRENFDSYSV